MMVSHGPRELSVVIVSYQSAVYLPACLRSLRRTAFEPPPRVVVVDNASPDGSADLVARDFPEVHLVRNRDNVGYSRAVNQAWREAPARFLLVLNPDIEVEPGSLRTLCGYLENHPEAGLVAPRLLNPDGSLQYSCRRHYTLATYLLRRTPLGRLFPDHPVVRRHLMADWDHGDVREVDWVLGAAMLLRGEALPDGVMDERYFIYFEDVDLCVRLRRQGWRVIYHPGAVMMHHHRRASAEGIWNRRKYEHLKSWVKFSLKHARMGRAGRS